MNENEELNPNQSDELSSVTEPNPADELNQANESNPADEVSQADETATAMTEDMERLVEKQKAEEAQKKEIEKHSLKSFFIGIGMGAVLLILILAVGAEIYFINHRNQVNAMISAAKGENPVGLTLGDNTALKMNTIQNVIDQYFLYEYDTEKMENAIYTAMMDSLDDPYSVYYTPEEYQDMMDSTDGVYYGVGIVVEKNKETGEVTVVKPYPNGPGGEAGIVKSDIIVAADGTALKDMDLDQAVTLIKGPEGTTVVLTIRRGSEEFDVELTRRKLEIITIEYEMLEGDIGYIQISQFDMTTVNQFTTAVDDLNSQGMKSLIIDVRGNPGGRLDAVCSMLDYLLPEGLIVYTVDKYGNREEMKSDAKTQLTVPCVVLVDGNSASASEIFAGALQDYELAEIIGTQTFGKGIVQTILKLQDGSALKITVEDYYTPNGNNIHGVGITPNQVVEFDSESYLADGTDNQLNYAKEYLERKMK